MSVPNQKTFKMKDWKCMQPIDSIIPIAESGRKLVPISIGEVPTPDGKKHVIEEIYDDVLEEVYSKNSDYKVLCDINYHPMITLLYNGSLAIHNEAVIKDKETVEKAMERLDKGILLQAFAEMRLNMELIEKLGESSKILIANIRKITGVNYSTAFIQAVLVKKLMDEQIHPTTSVAAIIQDFSYEELLRAACGIVEYRATQQCTIDPTSALVYKMNCPIDEVERLVQREITIRLINGQVAECKQ